MANTNLPIMGLKKIIVTGGNGQVGSELKLLSDHYKADFLFLGRDAFPLNDLQKISDVLHSEKPDVLINCGAYTAVDAAESDQDNAFLINADAVGLMAQLCQELSCQFIHISTDYVFDGTASTPYTVDAATHPMSVYGASKQKGESLAQAANPNTIIVRTAWVYSAFGKNFVKTMMRLMDEHPELGVVEDQLGSPTYAADLAEALLEMAFSDNPSPGIYHFTNDGVTSWFDFAQEIKRLHGAECTINPIPTSAYPTPAKRPAYSVLDTTKIFNTFPTLKPIPWKESLKRCLDRIH